ncbi:hypothetical protein QQG09_08825 [Melissococcus plutonius]|uniref:hypothetical protein n=1 Tax=Melissococcus plutonius TaxID=33970 RepID=UPI0021E57DB2|nr:hypothetical protein [Melissococcus plutonius]MCV2505674.1 hypothetical protein [Melissococcus plutonius]
MDAKTLAVLDRYLTILPDNQNDIADGELDWALDDYEHVVCENDWIFIAYFNYKDTKRKIIAAQEGFLSALDEYDPANLITDKLEIISGKEWLAMQKGND